MPTIEDLFIVEYGHKLDMNKQTRDPNGVSFVGRKGSGQGVSGRVREIPDVTKYPAGMLTTALGGSRLLATFVQQEPFYTAQNVAVLTPRDPDMPLNTRLFYAMAITANRYRYTAFGREANRSLRTIPLPDEVPDWVADAPTPGLLLTNLKRFIPEPLTPVGEGDVSETVALSELFDIAYGQSLELNRLIRVQAPDGINFVARTTRNNGVTARVLLPSGVSASPAGCLTVALSGSPLAAFYQPEPFICAYHVAVLSPRRAMTVGELLWWSHIIRSNTYRYSYGRQANRTLSSLRVPSVIPGYAGEVIKFARDDKLFPSQRTAGD